jgi:hypothetical protein
VKIGVASGCLIVFLVMSQVFLNTFDSYVAVCNEKYYDDRNGLTKAEREEAGWGVPELDDSYTNSTPDCPSYLRPAPCNGYCEECPEDPDCSEWMDFMMDQEGMLSICPAPNKEYLPRRTGLLASAHSFHFRQLYCCD